MTECVPSGPTRTCWIESFTDIMSGVPSPDIFLKWSAIATVGAAMARRVWSTTANSPVFPNIYCLLVAPPGVGKTVGIQKVTTIAERCGKIKVSPSDMTRASLLDAIQNSRVFEILSNIDVFEQHSLFVGLDELGTMISSYDNSILSIFTAMYDNRDMYKESRRGREEDMILTNPQLNLLAGTQPDFLANLLPPEAWGMGFMSRMIMVYHGKPSQVKLFGAQKTRDTEGLTKELTEIGNLFGEMAWTDAAQGAIMHWHENGMLPVPTHSKLKHYNSRRILQILKLSMISSASRSSALVVDDIDVYRAIDWLIEVEALMPDIFKDMNGKSDDSIIQDLHAYLYQISFKNGQKQMFHRSKIEVFLMPRTPAYNIQAIVQSCIRAGVLIDKGADNFIIGNKNGVE